MRERELREGFCQNQWSSLRSRVISGEEDQKVACSVRREAQQGVKCWGCGEEGHYLWACPKKVARPQKGEAQHREVRRTEEKKVQRKWHERERRAERMEQLWKREERGWIKQRRGE